MKKKTSLKDIAKQVGVSIALVSYVLNNKKEGRINKDLAQRIKETAQSLNYRANQIAKSLKTNKTYTIGLIVSDISNPFSSSLARIIEDEADKSGYTVIFGSSDEDAQKSQKLIDTFINRQVDGLIIAPSENAAPQIRYLLEENIPFVLIDRYFPEIDTNYVALDNFRASFDATTYLLKAGYRRPGIINYETSLQSLEERKSGYIAAYKQHTGSYKKSLIKEIRYEELETGVAKAINTLLTQKEPADAVLFASNIIAIYGLKYIARHNIQIPAELGIISFDESDALDLFRPSLTYIKQPLQEMGQVATRMLLDNIARNNKTSQVKMNGELIIRQSVHTIPFSSPQHVPA